MSFKDFLVIQLRLLVRYVGYFALAAFGVWCFLAVAGIALEAWNW